MPTIESHPLVAQLRAATRDCQPPTTLDEAISRASNPELLELLPEKPIGAAAVLVGIVLRERPAILMTQRAAHLKSHPGQVSFPGGKVEANESFNETAVRETHEETGVHPSEVTLFGGIEPFVTITHFCVVPRIGTISPDYRLVIDETEVAEAFELPLDIALDLDAYESLEFKRKGKSFPYHQLQYKQFKIWGATAEMLYQVACRHAQYVASLSSGTIDAC